MFDEALDSSGNPREHYKNYVSWLKGCPSGYLDSRMLEADLMFRRIGITFAVYGDGESTERLIPSDPVPRIIPADEWAFLEKGLEQRVTALNMFLHDVYHEGKIFKDGIIPAEKIYKNAQFQPCMMGLDLPNQVYSLISGVDIIRNDDGNYYVLEDNLRVPSGVSYMLQNRRMSQRLFPELFAKYNVLPVERYPSLLRQTLSECSFYHTPTIVVLTPGPYNSAYYEHAYLAKEMGVELVEGRDLFVRDNRVWMRTVYGEKQVDMIYRRVDDAFLDPLVLNPDSYLGVPGLINAYRAGNVAIANALGTGVADDKSVYPYVPQIIKYYLDQDPILHNVPTRILSNKEDLQYTLDNLDKLVVKEVHGAGGYGMLVGPASTKAEREKFAEILKSKPDGYISQPTLSLSTCGIWLNEDLSPRHIDLRPFVLSGNGVKICPGGLTRVALTKGSLVVNSSQGGGTKDTWVLADNKI
ncbi:MAG: circularly permuted type 2 ATP-grasp protein [Neisseriaceae bacterium]|nr:MAG: circularly permuted type 2 ATP-grasp protein [Neisseriaceae bacterium]